MSRDTNGNYTLPPVINPVISNTNITVAWANPTLADIAAALTDSLSRSGAGGMSAPLRAVDGTVSAPGYSFSGESSTGFYRVEAATVGLAISGLARYRFRATGAEYWSGDVWLSLATTTPYGQTLLNAVDAGGARSVLGASVVNKNRFANGAFSFDQRNNGAAVSVTAGPLVRTLDCVGAAATGTGVFNVQQQGAVSPPGTANYIRATVTTPDASMAATDQYQIIAQIEGLDVADLGFGSAAARPLSIGFWFRSSITGTFSGAVRNGAFDRRYVCSWPYLTPNVWQYVTVQNIPGDIAGVWPVGAVQAMSITFSLGAGTNFSATPSAWGDGVAHHATGGTNLISTSGATMDIALLQVEAGAVCTPFEWVPHQAGLARVRRYFRTYRASSNDGISFAWAGNVLAGAGHWAVVHFDPPMRATPTTDLTGAVFTFASLGSPVVAGNSSTAVVVQYTGTASGAGTAVLTGGQITVSVEL